ncbi:MAG: glycoside hydrolase family 25 protein, partial [Candidatus Nanopelagicaceae bacterium]
MKISKSSRSRTAILLTSLFLLSLSHAPSYGATSSTFFVTQTPSIGEPIVSLHGVVKPAVAGAEVRILTKDGDRWIDSGLVGKSTSLGTWKIRTTLPPNQRVDFKAEVAYQSRSFTTVERSLRIRPASTAVTDSAALISTAGPGVRIYGSDVSRWQHPNDQPINFRKMYQAGMRFVMIKASDTRDDSDALARKYLAMDRHAAQAAGLYTGFYHYATMPNTSSRRVVIEDAKAQAQRAVWRLASVGGYTELDLPYALDLENNCVAYSGRKCIKYSTKRFNTLWAETWLETVHEKTGRKPFLYSYPAFLERALVRSEKLRTYPLWLSHFGINPANEGARPGRKVVGCYVHS